MVTTSADNFADGVSRVFIEKARELITQEYLPKIEGCFEKLTDAQVWWRPNSESNSIGNLVLHLCGNARQWIVCGLGSEPDERQRQMEFDARDVIPRVELLRNLKTTVSQVGGTLASFDPTLLLDDYRIQGTNTTALAAIFHVTEHFSMHTGQIILVTKQLTAQDLHFYDL
ncbi:MAG TPA: DinB family protein [Pyrinomonadaceae bacterium]|nr:DinB family protein [Pyrinomonadaceae bacterium]